MKAIEIRVGGIPKELISRIGLDELWDDDMVIYFSDGGDRVLSDHFTIHSGCNFLFDYLEQYMEQILSHETIHLTIYSLFCGGGYVSALYPSLMLDSFDNWGLHPISFF